MRLSNSDRVKLREVRAAIDIGEIGTGVESLRKFTKAHALRQYQELKAIRVKKWIQEMIDTKPDNYYCIQHEIDFFNMLSKIKKEKWIGLDTETTGLEFWKDFIVGISISLPDQDLHYYIPYGHTTGEAQLSKELVLSGLKPTLS